MKVGFILLAMLLFVGLYGVLFTVHAQLCPFDCWISWNYPNNPDTKYCAVYVGEDSARYTQKHVFIARDCLGKLPCLDLNKVYFITATFIDSTGNESGYSDQIVYHKDTRNIADLNGDTFINQKDYDLFMREWKKVHPTKPLWKRIIPWIN